MLWVHCLPSLCEAATAVPTPVHRDGTVVSGDLEGGVYLWGLGPQGHPRPTGEGTPGIQLLGRYRHSDWVRALDESNGMLVSCCKAGEVKLADGRQAVDEAAAGDARPGSRSSRDTLLSSGPSEAGAQRHGGADRGHARQLRVSATWQLDAAPGLSQDGSAAPRTHANQAFGVAADANGIVAGCHDTSIRVYWFSNTGSTLCYA